MQFLENTTNDLESGEKPLPFPFQRDAQAFRTSDKQSNYEIRVLLHVLSIDPHAETEEVDVS